MERTCKDCNYWKQGDCKRFPPQGVGGLARAESGAEYVEVEWFQPRTRAGDWCSEWAKKTMPSARAATIPIAASGLSVRPIAAARRLNITNLAELTECTDVELLSMPNFGVVSLKEVRRRLSAFGLSLRGEG